MYIQNEGCFDKTELFRRKSLQATVEQSNCIKVSHYLSSHSTKNLFIICDYSINSNPEAEFSARIVSFRIHMFLCHLRRSMQGIMRTDYRTQNRSQSSDSPGKQITVNNLCNTLHAGSRSLVDLCFWFMCRLGTTV